MFAECVSGNSPWTICLPTLWSTGLLNVLSHLWGSTKKTWAKALTHHMQGELRQIKDNTDGLLKLKKLTYTFFKTDLHYLFLGFRLRFPLVLPPFPMSSYTHPDCGPNKNTTTLWPLLTWPVVVILLPWRSRSWWQKISRSSLRRWRRKRSSGAVNTLMTLNTNMENCEKIVNLSEVVI